MVVGFIYGDFALNPITDFVTDNNHPLSNEDQFLTRSHVLKLFEIGLPSRTDCLEVGQSQNTRLIHF